MKKLFAAGLMVTSLATAMTAQAVQQTMTLGYAQSKVDDFKDIRGVNVKYRYEWNSPFSVMGSFTYMSGKENDSHSLGPVHFKGATKAKYYSVSAGPAYRINKYVSIYGLVGVNYNNVESRVALKDTSGIFVRDSETNQKTSLAYGAGVHINPVDNVGVDIGYEGSKMDLNGKSYAINGFNIGVGYRF